MVKVNINKKITKKEYVYGLEFYLGKNKIKYLKYKTKVYRVNKIEQEIYCDKCELAKLKKNYCSELFFELEDYYFKVCDLKTKIKLIEIKDKKKLIKITTSGKLRKIEDVFICRESICQSR